MCGYSFFSILAEELVDDKTAEVANLGKQLAEKEEALRLKDIDISCLRGQVQVIAKGLYVDVAGRAVAGRDGDEDHDDDSDTLTQESGEDLLVDELEMSDDFPTCKLL